MISEETQTFDTVYYIAPVSNVSAVLPFCKQVKFLSKGKEPVRSLHSRFHKELRFFKPEQDAIVAVGNSNHVIIAGMVLREKFPNVPIWLGVYYSPNEYTKAYEWISI